LIFPPRFIPLAALCLSVDALLSDTPNPWAGRLFLLSLLLSFHTRFPSSTSFGTPLHLGDTSSLHCHHRIGISTCRSVPPLSLSPILMGILRFPSHLTVGPFLPSFFYTKPADLSSGVSLCRHTLFLSALTLQTISRSQTSSHAHVITGFSVPGASFSHSPRTFDTPSPGRCQCPVHGQRSDLMDTYVG